MYLKIIVFFLFFQLNFLSAQENKLAKQRPLEAATDLLKSNINEGKFAGVVAGISVDRKFIWLDAAGYKNIADQQKITSSTALRIASIAKPMTAVAIMQLCEQGKMGLDLPIQIYLPYFPKKEEGDITVRHLLNHTSGIAGYKGKESESNKRFETLKDAVDVFKDRSLLFEPGTAYHYTTYGYVVLGLIIEQVSGISYPAYMEKNIWDKIGMNHTTVEDRSQSTDTRSNVYVRNKKGKVHLTTANELSNRIPGGGLESTVGDILKFGNAMLENILISKESFALMLQSPQVQNQGNPYGFGWTLYGESPKYGDVIGHSGGQTGAAAQLFILPEIKTVIIVMANTSGVDTWENVFRIGVQLFDIAADFEK